MRYLRPVDGPPILPVMRYLMESDRSTGMRAERRIPIGEVDRTGSAISGAVDPGVGAALARLIVARHGTHLV